MKNRSKFSLLLAATFFLGVQSVSAQVYNIAQGGLYFPGGVSDNGVVSVVQGTEMYMWNNSAGLVSIGSQTNEGSISGKVSISNDGLKIAGTTTNSANGLNEMSIYDVATQTWQNLGGIATSGLGEDLSSSWGISADGSTIVGLGFLSNGGAHAVKWNANGMVDLGTQFPDAYSRANAISADNNTIVGWQDQENGDRNGAKWVNGVLSYILDAQGNKVGEASTVSADGKTIAGSNFGSAYVWNETTAYTEFSHSNPVFNGAVTAISGDGKTAVGYFRGFGAPPFAGEGFIWTAESGNVDLNTYVTSLGIDTQGIKFGLPLAISQDGKKIVGTGEFTGTFQPVAYMIDLTSALSTQNVAKETISIAPNPVKEFFTISGKNIEKAVIYNMTGQKMKDLKIVNGKADISYLSKGLYILQVESAGKKQNIKFIKE